MLRAKKSKRLGLLGMRERLDMVGGNFTITARPGKGTTVIAQIPLIHRAPRERDRRPQDLFATEFRPKDDRRKSRPGSRLTSNLD